MATKNAKQQIPLEVVVLSHQEVLDIISEILIERLGVTGPEVTEEATLIDDLGAESVDAVDIAFTLDERLHLNKGTAVLMLFAGHMRAMTVGDLCVGLERLLKEAGRLATI